MISRTALLTLSTAIALAFAGCTKNESQGGDTAAPTVTQANVEAAENAVAGGGAKTGEMCGGMAGIQCASANDFCQTEAGQCGTADAAGKCATKPEICTKEYIPVCGCDGKTYGNACEAAAAGVNVDKPGECSKQG